MIYTAINWTRELLAKVIPPGLCRYPNHPLNHSGAQWTRKTCRISTARPDQPCPSCHHNRRDPSHRRDFSRPSLGVSLRAPSRAFDAPGILHVYLRAHSLLRRRYRRHCPTHPTRLHSYPGHVGPGDQGALHLTLHHQYHRQDAGWHVYPLFLPSFFSSVLIFWHLKRQIDSGRQVSPR